MQCTFSGAASGHGVSKICYLGMLVSIFFLECLVDSERFDIVTSATSGRGVMTKDLGNIVDSGLSWHAARDGDPSAVILCYQSSEGVGKLLLATLGSFQLKNPC